MDEQMMRRVVLSKEEGGSTSKYEEMQPRPQLSDSTPIPEFMWCQRSDRVYVTIKVADVAEVIAVGGDVKVSSGKKKHAVIFSA